MTQRYPAPITAAMVTRAYNPVFTWNGGVFGDETVAETNVVVDDRSIGDYLPRNSVEQLAAVKQGDPQYTRSVDITRPKGWLAPNDPYAAVPGAGLNPTIASLAPNTAVAGTPSPLTIIITGTNFTQWSVVNTAGVPSPYAKYNSPTKITLLMDPARSVAGTVAITVTDHSVTTAASTFTYT